MRWTPGTTALRSRRPRRSTAASEPAHARDRLPALPPPCERRRGCRRQRRSRRGIRHRARKRAQPRVPLLAGPRPLRLRPLARRHRTRRGRATTARRGASALRVHGCCVLARAAGRTRPAERRFLELSSRRRGSRPPQPRARRARRGGTARSPTPRPRRRPPACPSRSPRRPRRRPRGRGRRASRPA